MDKVLARLIKIFSSFIPIVYGKIFGGWPIWLTTVLFIAMNFAPGISSFIEVGVWIFASIAVIKAPLAFASLVFYIDIIIYALFMYSLIKYGDD